MDGLFRLCEHQLESIKPFFPKSSGVRWVDDHKVVSGSIYVQPHVCAGWMPQPPYWNPTKPSTTVAVAGRIRVSSP